jgi:hypothetical protein
MAVRSRNGMPRLVSWARNPPATEPTSIAAPLTTWPRPNTLSSVPSKPAAVSASTSHASVAPEKNVNPSPGMSETATHCQNGASAHHRRTYSAVATASVSVPSR